MDGLSITEEEFCSMKNKDQNLILFKNQIKTNLKLDQLSIKIDGYKLYYKITAIVGSVLVAGMGILFSMHFGG